MNFITVPLYRFPWVVVSVIHPLHTVVLQNYRNITLPGLN